MAARKGSCREITDRFRDRYSERTPEALRALQKEVIGADVGAQGYTTVEQADLLAKRLRLRPGMSLLDIGSGRGWPGLYLADKTACRVVLSDVPLPGLHTARRRARESNLDARCFVTAASARYLPFRASSFDAVVHTDTL